MSWRNLGRDADGKAGLARGSRVCHEGWDRQVSAARSPQNLCAALLRCRRRTGANPVSARSPCEIHRSTYRCMRVFRGREGLLAAVDVV